MAPPMKSNSMHVGAVFENATVIRLDNGIGALLALSPTDQDSSEMSDDDDDDEKENRQGKKMSSVFTNLQKNETYAKALTVKCAYVHISKAMDDVTHIKAKKKNKETYRTPETLFAKHFSVGSTIKKLRILNTSHWMDNIVSCATADSIVSAAVLSHADISPGAIYRAVPIISTLLNESLIVQLGIGVKGIVPVSHLFDKAHMAEAAKTKGVFRNKSRMDKFKVGNYIDVRCLTVSVNDKKCVLTAKKALIGSDINDGEYITKLIWHC